MPAMDITASHPETMGTPAPGTDPGRGMVEAIHIADLVSGPMRSIERVQAVEGVGLDGDRYASGAGHYSGDGKDGRQITFIEAEEIESLADRAAIELAPGDTRRNVTTRGIRLNALVGRRFRIGAVECEGIRLCEPCQYLTDLLGKPILEPLVHRAGLRARILVGGEITLGDEVIALD